MKRYTLSVLRTKSDCRIGILVKKCWKRKHEIDRILKNLKQENIKFPPETEKRISELSFLYYVRAVWLSEFLRLKGVHEEHMQITYARYKNRI